MLISSVMGDETTALGALCDWGIAELWQAVIILPTGRDGYSFQVLELPLCHGYAKVAWLSQLCWAGKETGAPRLMEIG